MGLEVDPGVAEAGDLVGGLVHHGGESGAIITVTSLDSHIRGQQHTRPDGRIIRPSLVLLDDPQTRESARNPLQTKYRMQLLNGDVLGMAGPGESISAVLTCTKIYDDDMADRILDREKNPEWQGECTKMVYSFPTSTKLWDRYAEIRAESLRMGGGGKEATDFYREHRDEMDAGAVVAWSDRYDKGKELSALQHAMNLRQRDEEAFLAEYQNEPVQEVDAEEILTPDQVQARFNGRPRLQVPLACTHLTMFVDVHDKLLFYTVCAWQDDFTGFVVDYGTFPRQGRSQFSLRNARKTLGAMYPGATTEGAVQAGLEALVAESLGREFARADGASMRVERLLVDSGYLPGVVETVKHKVGGSAMVASKGVGITAGRKPMSTYARKPGEIHGHHWYFPSIRKSGEFPHVMIDTNYWKSFVHARLAALAGDRGAMTLFGSKKTDHSLFAQHVAGSEAWTHTEGHGRSVREWKLRPLRPDNHWLDCLVGCALGASILGVKTPEQEAVGGRRRRKKVSIASARGRGLA